MNNVAKRRTLLAGLTAALLLTTSLTAVSLVASQSVLADDAADQASVIAFFDAGYGVCDADVLASFWGVDFWDAKVGGGQKVQDGHSDLLSSVLSQAYGSHICNETSSLDYNDSTTVAALWTQGAQS